MLGLSYNVGIGSYTRIKGGSTPPWNPLALGNSIYDMWDADNADTITAVGGIVSSWASVKNGYAATQAVTSFRPSLVEASLNGRASIVFDGSDDELTYPGLGVFPVGAAPGEIWILVDQKRPASSSTLQTMFGYGSGVSGRNMRRVNRTPISGVNRAAVGFGDGTALLTSNETTRDFTGVHVIRGVFGDTSSQVEIDGSVSNPNTGVMNTFGNVLRFGATPHTLTSYLNCALNMVAITAPLDATQAGLMRAFMKTRGGLV